MVDIAGVNSGIINTIKGQGGALVSALGWLIFAIVLIGGSVGGYWYYINQKKFRKKITAFEMIGINYSPTYRDTAKTVKIGRGGFEVLYLKKAKTWKLAYGGRVGKDSYYFFIGKDGYWYNGMLGADIYTIDKNNGLIPIITTNPTMRAQYTALEKQIDTLHAQKTSFWDKYGNWVLSISFVLIIGVMAWLIFKEMSPLMGQFAALTDRMTILTDRMNELVVNLNSKGGTGLI